MKCHWLRIMGVTLVALLLITGPAMAAETVHLYLKIDRQDVQGESTQHSLGRENSIECVRFEQGVATQWNASSNSTGKVQYAPITCVKRVDKSSPLLVKALVEGQVVDAVFKFFRPSPIGDGTTQQFFTVQISDARIVDYKIKVPDTIDPASSNTPPLEEVSFVYNKITWTFMDGGVTYSNTGKSSAPSKTSTATTGQGYDLKAEATGQNVVLKWAAPPEAAGKSLQGYIVYRSTDPNRVVDAANSIVDFPVEKPTLTDVVRTGTYYYAVQAVLKDGTKLDASPATKVVIP
ncbi:MAG: type VI secretion system tube protein TssD [Mycobacterium leprae]